VQDCCRGLSKVYIERDLKLKLSRI
jgi:hypothetical protein